MDFRSGMKQSVIRYTFVWVDAQGNFVLICDYTGKEVVE
jgi:hypothetical protein